VARSVIANQYADIHISLHYDGTNTDAGVFYIGIPNVSSYRNMTPVKQNWKKHEALGKALIKGCKSKSLKIRGSGRMAIDLTQNSYSTIPSVCMEMGDKASSLSKSTQTKLAKGLVAGIKNYL